MPFRVFPRLGRFARSPRGACRPAFLVLTLGLALAGWSGPAGAMSYRLVTFDDGRCRSACPQAIFAAGEIELAESQRLAAFLLSLGGVAPRNLILHSPGGNLAGALRLGQGLRTLGMRTVVASVLPKAGGGGALRPGRCASACVFVLMGGPARIVPNGSRILVHSPRRSGGEQRDIVGTGMIDQQIASETVTALLQDYTRRMGVDPALVALANSVPNTSARELTRAEIARFHLARPGGR